jgi:hypothetical protein
VTGTLDLSHGQPVTLARLATFLFEHFGCPQLLRVGALPAPADDNYQHVFAPTPQLIGTVFRDTLPAVADYLGTCLATCEEQA